MLPVRPRTAFVYGLRFPGTPVGLRANARLEREQFEFAFKNVEEFLGFTVEVGSDIEPGGNLDLEDRPSSLTDLRRT